MLTFGLFLFTLASLAIWLRLRPPGDDGRGDDRPDPPDEPRPDPGPDRGDALDPDAFDRARAQWEQELKRG
jgi:hypothetical protein